MRSLPFGLFDGWLTRAPAEERVGWLRQATYAHRGVHGAGVPENSLAGFALAIERGLGIECDIQPSSDGHAMVFHDAELDRLTDASGPIAARGVGELTKLRLKDSEEPLPTLRDLLRLVDGRVPLLLEIKSQSSHRTNGLCRSVQHDLEGYGGPVAVMSFAPQVPAWFARYAGHVVRGLVMSEDDVTPAIAAMRNRRACWQGSPEFLAYDLRSLPSGFAARLRKRGLPLLTWTVKSEEAREKALQYADALIAEGDGLE